MRKRIYVAGPYSCAGRCEPLGVDLAYMRKGLQVSAQLLYLGYAPFCPWLDYLFHFAADDIHLPSKNDYYEYSLSWLAASDAVLVIDQRPGSVGTWKEIELAKQLGIRVYYNIYHLMSDIPSEA